MASLKEVKGRIASVNSTLKITSAMKMVASAKLHRAQGAIENMLPYERKLNDILSGFLSSEGASNSPYAEHREVERVAIVAVSSNSSLCGAFNANAVHKTLDTCAGCGSVKVIPVGRKMAEAMKKCGYDVEDDHGDIIGKPDYYKSRTLARELRRRFAEGEFSKVLLVYNRYVSSSSQVPVVEQYLPYTIPAKDIPVRDEDYIFEPDPTELAAQLVPYLLTMKFHAAVLDSAAAEHAARTVAMQTASENAERLLAELTLEYNKGRQEKITSEILDLESGEGGE